MHSVCVWLLLLNIVCEVLPGCLLYVISCVYCHCCIVAHRLESTKCINPHLFSHPGVDRRVGCSQFGAAGGGAVDISYMSFGGQMCIPDGRSVGVALLHHGAYLCLLITEEDIYPLL